MTAAPSSSVGAGTWEESAGLLGALLPGAGGAWASAGAFNGAAGELKLGPLPLADDLRAEAERLLEPGDVPQQPSRAQAPGVADLLPHPPAFRAVDVRREVERIRDARKRIRLEPALFAGVAPGSLQAAAVRARALPSVCAYTLHETAEG